MRRLGWKTIEKLIVHESKLVGFNSICGLALQYMSDLLTKTSQLTSYNIHNIATDLWLPQMRSNGQKCFSYRVVKTWNSLPTKCMEAIATPDFKSCL